MDEKKGSLLISLDFELYWGLKDSHSIDTFDTENISNVKSVIPRLLNLFEKYNVKATFATVGMLFLENFNQLEAEKPKFLPTYNKESFSPYNSLKKFQEYPDELFFAPELIRVIAEKKVHEIASHTFSHYYCLEEGQTLEQFREDLSLAKKVAEEKGFQLKSLVFPRNQFNEAYLNVCKELGYTSVRSTEKPWMYKATNQKGNKLIKRGFKLLDSYFNISGHNDYDLSELKKEPILELPSSCFLRPYSAKLSFLDKLRLHRIKTSMTSAAKKGRVYHLWWHPHNMAKNTDENFVFLEKILIHYSSLNKRYNFESLTMNQLEEKTR